MIFHRVRAIHFAYLQKVSISTLWRLLKWGDKAPLGGLAIRLPSHTMPVSISQCLWPLFPTWIRQVFHMKQTSLPLAHVGPLASCMMTWGGDVSSCGWTLLGGGVLKWTEHWPLQAVFQKCLTVHLPRPSFLSHLSACGTNLLHQQGLELLSHPLLKDWPFSFQK